jgi:ATP-dependent DNA helicase RecG
MRPGVLFPLFAPVTRLPGIGPGLEKVLAKLGAERVVDLLWHLPVSIVDRRNTPDSADAQPGQLVTLTLTVHKHERAAGRRPWRVLCGDSTGFVTLVFFNFQRLDLERMLPRGEQRVVSGVLEEYEGVKQMVHPDYVVTLAERDRLAAIEPVYPMTEGLPRKSLRRALSAALERLPDLPEWIDGSLLAARGWPDWRAGLRAVHAPQDGEALSPLHPARMRLSYDELLAAQVALRLVRAHQHRARGRRLAATGELRSRALAALPFALTGAQSRALREIDGDMAGENRMLRLLQGDVGSGKTVVAFLAALTAIECGAQAAFMAPTEILARQHSQTIAQLADSSGIRVAILTGRDTGRARAATLARIAAGEVDLVVGTHALVSEDVSYKDLAFAVIDEQHRFGVHQRLALSSKGVRPDILVMTATPIPRTLLLAHYGDLETSRLDEKPPTRKPIDTRVIPLERLEDIYPALHRALAEGAAVYWVCPLVEDSEAADLAAASERHRVLAERFGAKVGLVHGRLKAKQRDEVMRRFAQGEVRILVATTVIEVGVDVPDATIMVIEHAERFGLAQLHQLRGRVGRGTKPSTCLLLYQAPLGEIARARLAILRESEDGFRIAEEDLRLRGGGDPLGARQSGMPAFRLADLAAQAELLPLARDDAKLLLERDPELTGARGTAVRTLLYLFERDEGVRLLRSP